MISRGLSLAIPINTAGAWASGGMRTRRSRSRLGVRVQEAVLPASSRDPAGQEVGLVIAGVASGGPASRAGLLVGDVLLSVAGETVEDAASLRDALARAGDPVRLRMMRGGEVREIEAGFGGSGRARARGA